MLTNSDHTLKPTAVDMRWLPQGLASTRKNIINVAGHDPITMSNIYQTGPHVRISAPAWNVMTAKVSYEGDDRTYEYGEFNGTSYGKLKLFFSRI